MKKWLIVLASTGILSGCVFMKPTEAEPDILKESPRYEVHGREGWMPGKNIHFGGYAGEIEKGKISGVRDLYFSGPYLEEDDNREVLITQTDSIGNRLSLKYKQYCIIKGFRPPYDEDPKRESIKVTHDPNVGELEFKGKRWYLDQWVLDDRAGNQYRVDSRTIYLNDQVVAEFVMNHWTGGLSEADYVWLKTDASDESKLISAALITYLMTAEPLPCESRLD
ncbi:hypothetical protein TUMSATVNIG1_53770 [Vibrio nigripulchritudo]|uniref:hypothetical protein n=1 Tax=Vibrio nigripulchritudo TaxID=28173 RepID=UPI00190E04D1|nr:hypothetical protein [Vibrio nigripulchritudo]BCL73401.1 hypothetical protein VNTUMSATTG_53380 [Vibrio nigripulchritudo]BDU34768.1 hypothetical protein TUMSATVNIG1_53770 [Vibrio nigripulchritudo]